MSEIETLVSDARMPVALDWSGAPRRLPAIVDHSAYRVVQHALDAATCASAASVAIEFAPGALIVQVEDDGGGSRRDFDELRELAAAIGGGLRATREPGRFRVRAWLPTEGQPPSLAVPPAAR